MNGSVSSSLTSVSHLQPLPLSTQISINIPVLQLPFGEIDWLKDNKIKKKTHSLGYFSYKRNISILVYETKGGEKGYYYIYFAFAFQLNMNGSHERLESTSVRTNIFTLKDLS